MEFVLQQRNPGGKLAGIATVVAFHVLIVLVFMEGLAQHRIAFTPPSNIDWVAIIPSDPPPPKTALPKPVSTAVAPTQLLPPVVADMPPVVVDVVTVAPEASVSMSGQSATAVGEQVAASASLGAACPNAQGVRSSLRYPAQARRDGLQGEVVAQFLVAANGDIRNIVIVSSSNRAFNNTVINAVKQFNCVGLGRDVAVEVPFSFKLD